MTQADHENENQLPDLPVDRTWVRYLPSFLRRRFENRHVFQEVVENSGWLMADRILRMGVGLVVGVWVARYLGPDEYGRLSYAGALVGLASALSSLGIESIVIRELVRKPHASDDLLGTTFSLRFAAGFATYLLLLAVVVLLRPADSVAHLLVGVLGWTLALAAFDTIDYWFQSRVLSKYVVWMKTGAFLASAGLRICLIISHATVLSFAIANLVEFSLGSLGLLYIYGVKKGSIRRWCQSLSVARELLRNGWPVLLSSIVTLVGLRVDQVILGQLADSKEVGVYAAAVRIAEVWFFVPTAVIGSVFPNIIRAREVDEAEFYRRLQKLYNFLAFAGYVVAIPLTFLSGQIIQMLYGKPYAAAAPMLTLLVWSDLFMNLAMARGAFLLAMNWTWPLFWINAFAAVANIALNFALIPRFGGVGAAVASCISYWVSAHGACYLVPDLRKTAHMMTHALLRPRFW